MTTDEIRKEIRERATETLKRDTVAGVPPEVALYELLLNAAANMLIIKETYLVMGDQFNTTIDAERHLEVAIKVLDLIKAEGLHRRIDKMVLVAALVGSEAISAMRDLKERDES